LTKREPPVTPAVEEKVERRGKESKR
jgi:hypothetical protein